MINTQDVYELSSDEELPKKACGSRSWGPADVICLDDEPEPATPSKMIAITIEDSHVRSLSESTKITIQFEGSPSNSSQSNADNNFIRKDTTTRRVQVQQTSEPSNTIRRVDLISQPINETVKETQHNDKTVNKVLKNGEEFSKCYTDFMKACLEADGSQDMRVILEKKVKRYYRKADERYVRSQEFERLVADKTARLRSTRRDMWVHIKDVVDTLRDHRKNSSITTQSDGAQEPSRQREIKELESRLQMLQRVVQRLEDAELDFEQEELSVYVRADKYKAQLLSVHEQLCRLRGVRAPSHARMRIERSAGRAPGPAARLELWVNAPVAAGQPPRFPDFHDVVACVREACLTDQLDWSDAQVMREARELFTQCGRALQQLRQRREWRLASSRLPAGGGDDGDPAERSAELQATLSRNRTIARQREQQVFDEFETKQMLGTYLPKSKVSSDNKTESGRAEESIEGPENKTKVPHTEETIQESAPHSPHKSDTKIIEKKCDSEKGIDLTDDKSGDGDIGSGVEAQRRETPLNPDSECEVLSSDDCSSDNLEESSPVRTADRLDDDIERLSVSDSSVCSEQDSLHLLRRVEARRGAGLRYSTRVSTSPTVLSSASSTTSTSTSSSDCESDSSACVLVQSDRDTHSPSPPPLTLN